MLSLPVDAQAALAEDPQTAVVRECQLALDVPQTAAGVTFMTLEDETGFVNLVVWSQIFERFERFARTAVVLGISGRLQSQESVVHLIADELWQPALPAPVTTPPSRGFH